jgi:hypothetical protein
MDRTAKICSNFVDLKVQENTCPKPGVNCRVKIVTYNWNSENWEAELWS